MREMIKIGSPEISIKVIQHIITRHGWEYYVTDTEGEIGNALVMGLEIEYGSFYINEIKKFTMFETKDLSNVFPATGYEWKE